MGNTINANQNYTQSNHNVVTNLSGNINIENFSVNNVQRTDKGTTDVDKRRTTKDAIKKPEKNKMFISAVLSIISPTCEIITRLIMASHSTNSPFINILQIIFIVTFIVAFIFFVIFLIRIYKINSDWKGGFLELWSFQFFLDLIRNQEDSAERFVPAGKCFFKEGNDVYEIIGKKCSKCSGDMKLYKRISSESWADEFVWMCKTNPIHKESFDFTTDL